MAIKGNGKAVMESLSRLDAICDAGYAVALHIRYTAPKFLFQTYARDWMETYSQRALVLKDPTVLWGFDNTGAIRWRDLEPLDTEGVLELARAHGLNHGFTFAIDDKDGRTISSFARKDREFSDDEISEISGIVRDLHSHTAGIDDISPAERAQLKNMSVAFTRP